MRHTRHKLLALALPRSLGIAQHTTHHHSIRGQAVRQEHLRRTVRFAVPCHGSLLLAVLHQIRFQGINVSQMLAHRLVTRRILVHTFAEQRLCRASLAHEVSINVLLSLQKTLSFDREALVSAVPLFLKAALLGKVRLSRSLVGAD